ncbi:hypothetical protein KKG46_01170 [Patescibacteria group bacterium]|nr:hypothetical protein [Patescibacteria group bacterium]
MVGLPIVADIMNKAVENDVERAIANLTGEEHPLLQLDEPFEGMAHRPLSLSQLELELYSDEAAVAQRDSLAA